MNESDPNGDHPSLPAAGSLEMLVAQLVILSGTLDEDPRLIGPTEPVRRLIQELFMATCEAFRPSQPGAPA